MKRQPSMNGLRAFEATARLSSVVLAADELFVTASAVSHQLRRLERELETSLFTRNGNRLSLTLDGEAYFRDVHAAFEQLRLASQRFTQRSSRKTVTISTIPVFAVRWLVPRLGQFHALHRDIEVRIGTSYRFVDLVREEVDLAIRWGSGRWPNLQCEKLLGDSVQPVCSPRLLGRKRLRKHKDVFDYPLIHMNFTRDDWTQWAAANQLEVPVGAQMLRFNDPAGAIQAALDGLGIVLGPQILVYDDLLSGRLLAPLANPIALQEAYYVAQPDHGRQSSSAIVFKKWLCETAAAFTMMQQPAIATIGPVDTSRGLPD